MIVANDMQPSAGVAICRPYQGEKIRAGRQPKASSPQESKFQAANLIFGHLFFQLLSHSPGSFGQTQAEDDRRQAPHKGAGVKGLLLCSDRVKAPPLSHPPSPAESEVSRLRGEEKSKEVFPGKGGEGRQAAARKSSESKATHYIPGETASKEFGEGAALKRSGLIPIKIGHSNLLIPPRHLTLERRFSAKAEKNEASSSLLEKEVSSLLKERKNPILQPSAGGEKLSAEGRAGGGRPLSKEIDWQSMRLSGEFNPFESKSSQSAPTRHGQQQDKPNPMASSPLGEKSSLKPHGGQEERQPQQQQGQSFSSPLRSASLDTDFSAIFRTTGEEKQAFYSHEQPKANPSGPHEEKAQKVAAAAAVAAYGKYAAKPYPAEGVSLPASWAAHTASSSPLEEIWQQIAPRLNARIWDHGHSLTVDLHPDHLGRLHISLELKGDMFRAHLAAESPKTQKILEENLASLKLSLARHLADWGIEVKQFSVSIGGGGGAGGEGSGVNGEGGGFSGYPKGGEYPPRREQSIIWDSFSDELFVSPSDQMGKQSGEDGINYLA
ncbi:MAG: flagellar hook-length control protein FliK [bacterium]|nr:flagellar hook-length control protein FliK [bacterium]